MDLLKGFGAKFTNSVCPISHPPHRWTPAKMHIRGPATQQKGRFDDECEAKLYPLHALRLKHSAVKYRFIKK